MSNFRSHRHGDDSDTSSSASGDDGDGDDGSWSNDDPSVHDSGCNVDGLAGVFDGDFEANDAKSAVAVAKKDDPYDANVAWDKIKGTQVFAALPTSKQTKQPSNCTRIVCMSDTHGKHRGIPFLPKGNVFVHGGDFTKSGEIGNVHDLTNYFGEHMSQFDHILCVAGNHEITFHPEFYETSRRRHKKPFDPYEVRAALKNCIYLEDATATLDDNNHKVEAYGSPWTPVFYDWAFNLERSELGKVWSRIPSSTDILITHGPPLGRGDFIDHSGRAGCHDLLQQVQTRIQPRLHVFGHIHQSYGVWFDGTTLFVNASNLDSETEDVALHHPCVVVDLPHDPACSAQMVLPDCKIETFGGFQEWLEAQQQLQDRNKHYPKLAACVFQLDSNPKEVLPIVDCFSKASAFLDLCTVLNLERNKEARIELRRALWQIYAESFS